LSQTNIFGATPNPEMIAHWRNNRSGICRDGIITADNHREYPDTITNTGGESTCPNPNATSAGGNRRSHCAICPASYSVRRAGSGGRKSGRNSRTRFFTTVSDRVQPRRSAVTVAGIVGHILNNSRICGSTSSTIEPFNARSYFGGARAADARRTVFRPTPS
jgi:hypothetical protein